MFLNAVLCLAVIYVQLRCLVMRCMPAMHPLADADADELQQKLNVWHTAQQRCPQAFTSHDGDVRRLIGQKVVELNRQLTAAAANRQNQHTEITVKESLVMYEERLAAVEHKYGIYDKCLLIKVCVTVAYVVVMYAVHAIPGFARMNCGWVMFTGALLLIVLCDNGAAVPQLVHQVEWGTLLFVAAVFVMVEGLRLLGLFRRIGDVLEVFALSADQSSAAQMSMAVFVIIWVSVGAFFPMGNLELELHLCISKQFFGSMATLLNNAPVTIALLPVIDRVIVTMNLRALPIVQSFALAMGLGGSGCLFGAASNVLAVDMAQSHGVPVSFGSFLM